MWRCRAYPRLLSQMAFQFWDRVTSEVTDRVYNEVCTRVDSEVPSAGVKCDLKGVDRNDFENLFHQAVCTRMPELCSDEVQPELVRAKVDQKVSEYRQDALNRFTQELDQVRAAVCVSLDLNKDCDLQDVANKAQNSLQLARNNYGKLKNGEEIGAPQEEEATTIWDRLGY